MYLGLTNHQWNSSSQASKLKMNEVNECFLKFSIPELYDLVNSRKFISNGKKILGEQTLGNIFKKEL